MRVKEIMSASVHTCEPGTDLGTVAAMMWEYDCGIIPVVGASGAVMGLVTDRDICIAAATRQLAPGHISARQAMSETVHACFPDDSIAFALASMKQFKVRRLPVVDSTRAIKGVISMNDIVRAARIHDLGAKDVIATLANICEPRTLAAVHS